MKKYLTEEFKNTMISAIENSNSMSEASCMLGIHFNTFSRYAKKLNLYTPNQGLKGVKGKKGGNKEIKLIDILNGNHPSHSTGKVKGKLIKAGLKENKCEECGITEWNNKKIVCHLDHIDGNRFNHTLSNLKMLCPNCHSQTETYCGKNTRSIIKKHETNIKDKYAQVQEKYITLILSADINFSKFGWVNDVSKIINQKPQKVNRWMKRIMPDFYNEKCFKRK